MKVLLVLYGVPIALWLLATAFSSPYVPPLDVEWTKRCMDSHQYDIPQRPAWEWIDECR